MSRKEDVIGTLKTVCFWLIKQCLDTNADILTYTQEGVTLHGKKLGDWEITCKRIKK